MSPVTCQQNFQDEAKKKFTEIRHKSLWSKWGCEFSLAKASLTSCFPAGVHNDNPCLVVAVGKWMGIDVPYQWESDVAIGVVDRSTIPDAPCVLLWKLIVVYDSPSFRVNAFRMALFHCIGGISAGEKGEREARISYRGTMTSITRGKRGFLFS